MELTVECQTRPEKSKPNALRRSGKIPAVLYGHKGAESIALTLNSKVAEQLLKKASLNNTLITLNIPELSWNGQTLLREVQSHSAKGFIYHLSFFAVSAHGTLEVGVRLHFVGEPVGVKLSGGMLDTVMTSIQVKCLPESIPDSIEVDVSALKVGDALHIRELTLPPGVTAIAEPNQLVVSVLNTQGGAPEAAEIAPA